jgi:Co/Zn/Cd efflux system component
VSEQQIQGIALLLVGLALLISSLGAAWALSRRSRTHRLESAWLVTMLSVVLLIAAVVACFGMNSIING